MPTGTKNADINTMLGQHIGKLRVQKGISQEELGKALGVTREVIQHWERGSRQIKASHLLQLADYFNIAVDHLLDENRPNTRDASCAAAAEYTGLTVQSVETLHLFSLSPEHSFVKRFFDDIIDFTAIQKAYRSAIASSEALCRDKLDEHPGLDVQSLVENTLLPSPNARGAYLVPARDAASFYEMMAVEQMSYNIRNSVETIIEELTDAKILDISNNQVPNADSVKWLTSDEEEAW